MGVGVLETVRTPEGATPAGAVTGRQQDVAATTPAGVGSARSTPTVGGSRVHPRHGSPGQRLGPAALGPCGLGAESSLGGRGRTRWRLTAAEMRARARRHLGLRGKCATAPRRWASRLGLRLCPRSAPRVSVCTE